VTTDAPSPSFDRLIRDEVESLRYRTLLGSLQPYRQLFASKRVLDFGASSGLSMAALLMLGASHVTGIEPDVERVQRGRRLLSALQAESRSNLIHVAETSKLPFPDSTFEFVLVNAVLEHIPQPRSRFIAELWRCVAEDGYLFVNETPNKYVPVDFHTTGGLWWVPWMPKNMARRYATWRGRWKGRDWDTCGWRGLGYYELTSALPGHKLIPELTRLRHRLLHRLGLPSGLVDPYPVWVLQKISR
jgi:SAM-dependent methyltransferase